MSEKEKTKEETPQPNTNQFEDPNVYMLTIHEQLKLMDYESKFCAAKGYAPLYNNQFAVASAKKGNEQFQIFVALALWVLNQIAQSNTEFNKYDDPNTVTSNLLVAAKKAGVEVDFPANKLIVGQGEQVCLFLSKVLDRLYHAKKFSQKKPVHFVGGDDMVEDQEDSEEENQLIEEQDEEDVASDARSEITDKELNEILNDENVNLIESQIDPQEWKLELERVGPSLKVRAKENLKDWRSKIVKVGQLQGSINSVIPEVKGTLEKLALELSRTTERIEVRESSINMNLDETAEEQRENLARLSELSEAQKQQNESVFEINSQVAMVEDRIEQLKGKMEEEGMKMTDTSPLSKIKASIAQLRKEVAALDIKIGVINHHLLKQRIAEKGKDKVDLEVIDEDELEEN